MGVLKLVVLPIIAVLWVKKLQSMGWIAPDDLMIVFVLIVTAAVPTATSQLVLTAMFSPPNSDEHLEIDCLAANLICQYSLLCFTLTIVVTYTLKCVVHL
jgi:hypothetical protein